MRTIRHLRRITLITLFIFVTTSLFAWDAPPPTVRVIFIQGKARYSSDSIKWKMVEKDSLIPANAIIQTADNSTLDIIVEKKRFQYSYISDYNRVPIVSSVPTSIRLFEGTVLKIDELAYDKSLNRGVAHLHLDLRTGSVMAQFLHPSTNADYQIKTSNSNVTLQRGHCHVAASGVVNVLTGQATIHRTDKPGTSSERIITANLRYNPGSDRMEPIPNFVPERPTSIPKMKIPPPLRISTRPPLRSGI